jgi:probable HAF family extracellular repeat protein
MGMVLPAEAVSVTYTVTDLGTLSDRHSRAQAINEVGQVIGYSYSAGSAGSRAFVWQAGVMTELTLGGSRSSATAINEAGQIIGYSYLWGDAGSHAFVWQAGVMTDLGTLGGSSSYATAINEAVRAFMHF